MRNQVGLFAKEADKNENRSCGLSLHAVRQTLGCLKLEEAGHLERSVLFDLLYVQQSATLIAVLTLKSYARLGA